MPTEITGSTIYVFGNSIASMVVVSELKKDKKKFLWIKDGTSVEGIWRGLNYKNRILDLGMINFELDVRHPESSVDLSTYSQYAVNDCARFSDYVLKFIAQYTKIRKLPKIMISEGSGIYNDHLISNDFSQLERYSGLYIDGIEKTVEDHPSLKYTESGKERLLDISYEDYVKKYFGQKLAQALFLSWATKLVGESVAIANTYRHRAAWLPLPYPETIFKSLSGENKHDYSYSFHYPTVKTFSEVINGLFLELNADQEIQKIELAQLGEEPLREVLNSNSIIFWGGKLEAFFKLMHEYPIFEMKGLRNLIDLDIYEVKLVHNFESYVYLNNDLVNNNWYRITILPNVVLEDGLQIAVVESRNSNIDFRDSKAFLDLGIKLESHVQSFRNIPVFLTLDGESYREYETWHKSLVRGFRNIYFGGGSSFAYSATFSDQVVQGMHFVREGCKDVGE